MLENYLDVFAGERFSQCKNDTSMDYTLTVSRIAMILNVIVEYKKLPANARN